MVNRVFSMSIRLILLTLLVLSNVLVMIPSGTFAARNSETISTLPDGAGKRVLFDNTHGQTAGAADWVIDGAFSDFAGGLKAAGFMVDELTRPLPYTFGEQAVTYEKLKDYDVFIIGEANIPYKKSEQDAMLQYVQNGGSIFFIADHYNADRNKNRWDASEVMNGFRRGAFDNPVKGMSSGEAASPAMQGVQSSDWLGSNFGIRFRYNAIGDVTANAIAAPEQSFGITEGVNSVAMHAGSTLAILDPNKAKGVVYLPPTTARWGSAVDKGVYNGGGKAEGPFAAISKLGLGKAAFIGDSSPVEDATPKYVREENGAKKTTYDGFKEADDGKFLVQTVKWLANKESYTGFDQIAGFQPDQPTQLIVDPAQKENENPATTVEPQAEPWAAPAAGYKWYDPATFKPGSYGANGSTQPPPPPPSGQLEYKVVRQSVLPSKQEFQVRVKADGMAAGSTVSGYGLGVYTSTGEQIARFKNADGTWSTYGYSPAFSFTADDKGHASKTLTVQLKPNKEGAANIRLRQNSTNLKTETVTIADVPAEPLPDENPIPAQISIAEARQAADGTTVTVEGTIISEPGVFGGQGFYIQDGDTGVYVFQTAEGFKQGDRIRICAVKKTFNTEVELADPLKVEKIGTAELPSAYLQSGVNEENQGTLIQLENVQIKNLPAPGTSGTFEFDAINEEGTTKVRVDGRTGIAFDEWNKTFAEGSIVNITGVASIFKGQYQLKPLSFGDFELSDIEAAVTKVTADGVTGEGQYNNKDVILTFSAADGAGLGVVKTEYRVNNSEWSTVEGTVTLSQEGRNVVEYRSIDRANNIEEIKSVAVWIDKTAPATKASTNGVAGEGHYNNADVTINFNAADGSGSGVAKTEYRLNNGEWMTVEGAVTLSQEGRNIVDYRSIDLANNLEEIKSVVVWIDKTAPATKASTNGAAEENQYNNEDVTIHFNAEDGSGSGVAKTEYRINSGQWMTVEGDVTLSREGKNAVDYRSTDFAGNVEESKRIEVWIDKTAPKITVEGSLSFYQTDSAIPVSIKIEDELSGFDKYELILDGTSISGLGEIKPVSLNPGEHTLTIRAEDGAGNSILKEVKLYCKIDIDHLDELITIGDDNNWITKEGTVKSLQSKVKAVQKAKKEKQLDKKLKDLFREIDSERGKTIQKEYADLLINDIEYILKNEI